MVMVIARMCERDFEVICNLKDLSALASILEASRQIVNYRVCLQGKYVDPSVLPNNGYYVKWIWNK